VDTVAFLWACMELLDGEGSRPGTAEVHAPQRPALHSVPDARTRILKLLGESPEPQSLSQLLPNAREAPLPSTAASAAHAALLRRSGWASAFAASLELAKQGAVTLAQERGFSTILMHAGPAQHAEFEKHTANQG